MGEAVFARLPIIVATDSFMAELAAEHCLGFAVPLGDSEALAALLVRLAQERSAFREIAENDLRAERMFAFGHYEPEFLGAFGALLDQKPRGETR
jgi:alkanesulfonate monooxygenase SsuD/methylene tetrahydromethanopterin reductase-like flavin-dependent oxidoreductase (luciferase family)